MRPVSDDAAIRRTNLRRLCKTRAWDAHALAAAVGQGGYSYWQSLLMDDKKSFGEKVARKIEERCSLPRLWLDAVQAPVPELVVKEDVSSYGMRPWPFSDELHTAVSSRNAEELLQLENLMRVHLRLSPLAGPSGKRHAA